MTTYIEDQERPLVWTGQEGEPVSEREDGKGAAIVVAENDPRMCRCGHHHWSDTSGEDSGCPCHDGHDWEVPVVVPNDRR